ncbi:MAG: PIG-L family deacetylase [Spirochaetota bacterium]
MKKRCLVVTPHPDDAELGMGGTILSLKENNHEVCLVDLTSGEPTPYGTEQKRKKETREATAIMGIDRRVNLGLPNRYLMDGREQRLLLAEQIRVFAPDIIFCPYPVDVHPDHYAATAITRGARFYAKYTGLSLKGEPHYTPYVFLYSCSHMRTTAGYSILFDISEHFEKKIEAAKCYRSQFIDNPKNRDVFEYVESRDRYYGNLIRRKYAEPFYCEEALGIKDFGHLL